MANFIGIEANRKGFLDAPPRTVLPLFLSFLAVQGATHACANNPGRAESYYNELGFVYNQRTGFMEKKLPRVKVQ